MHARYSTEITLINDREEVAKRYLAILQVVAGVQREIGIIPDSVPTADAALGAVNLDLLVRDWEIQEHAVKHETAGFVRALRRQLSDRVKPLVYLGLTSSDLIDTATALQWQHILSKHLQPSLGTLTTGLFDKCLEGDRRFGRTHGRLAEPVQIGSVYHQAMVNLSHAGNNLSEHGIPGKLSGPVGEFNKAVTIRVADMAAQALGVPMDYRATQIVNRRYYRQVAGDLIEIVSTCEQIATLHRLSSIEGVDLFAESFGVEQMGSSVMPYKRNPIKSERICGLGRVARGHYATLLETWSTGWWERDLTNSSVERIAWWDLIEITHRLLIDTAKVVRDGHWRSDLPANYASPVDEMIDRQVAGQDPEATYRDIQARGRS